MAENGYFSITANFNLREPKTRKPTNVYLVITINRVQYKFSLGVKVLPSQWHKKKQIAIISNTQSVIENHNNQIVNDKISLFKQYYFDFLDYLCNSGKPATYNLLRTFIYKDIMPRVQKQKVETVKLIRAAFDVLYDDKFGTSTYKEYEHRLNDFISYLEKKKLYTLEALGQYGLQDYQDYLLNEKKNSSVNTNKKCGFIQTLINNGLCKKKKFREYGFTTVSFEKLKDNRSNEEMGRFALTLEEQESLRNISLTEEKYDLLDVVPTGKNGKVNNKYRTHLSNKQLTEYLDIFLLQCNCGQRVSDIKQLLQKKFVESEIEGVFYYEIKTKKSKFKNSAFIEVDDTVQSFFHKYESGYSNNIEKIDTSNSYYNQAIKKLCLLAHIDRIIDYVDASGEQHHEPAYRIITNHDARHTFITNMIRKHFRPDILCWLTGHSDDTMIKQIYTHLTSKDKIKSISEEKIRVEKENSPIEEHNANVHASNDKDLIQEAKVALTYLGADAIDFIDIDDLDKLNRLIYSKYERDLIDKYNVDYRVLKKIYLSTHGTIKEKRKALLDFLDSLAARETAQ